MFANARECLPMHVCSLCRKLEKALACRQDCRARERDGCCNCSQKVMRSSFIGLFFYSKLLPIFVQALRVFDCGNIQLVCNKIQGSLDEI